MTDLLVTNVNSILGTSGQGALTIDDVKKIFTTVQGAKMGKKAVLAFVVLVFVTSLAILGIVSANWAKTKSLSG